MNTQETINYNRIAEAINYIKLNFKDQPDLDQVAEKINLSPFHFQRLFTDWAGISPKKFIQYLSLEYAKGILKEKNATLFDTAYETGLSGTGRLHDLFINLVGMTPAEYKNGGAALNINYSFAESPFGNIIVASTSKGICYMAFADDRNGAFELLQQQFPNATYNQVTDTLQQNALFIFQKDWSQLSTIKLHLKGTDFQLKVWEALLKIPMGGLSTYSAIAQKIESPLANRAVGSAVGDNPVAFLIPCHRVIKSTGEIGQYHWGSTRKSAIIGWEAAKVDLIKSA
ncbi:bifunctional helix-turn-helix domain-containing protein/methylated-DNA--[protein]-cysteine S-methyltransferase [Mucilaginibacter sp. X5P1]|uniref:bifunctional helix-turn-helix domain-containing protein/methylated-DNA--[protein]-cysteine S-methyltransferase n=1 Tax=Mucilaginibacter sp. X5P1 TaxID=2723088 RepID=UPI00161D291C|nr:methylated-DNA--[protein]-cysteine S-methyltransferase [Mucilaginibacter sp. X5P1]MBB6141251.1 AraC family transcriptional regulator of adaptative response/methylated-DNA-[protein]-cysteine methyltransferase [Mucilaginibacter sp. X5P1]